MWKAFLTLALVSHCLAAPQQQRRSAVYDLIDSVFGTPSTKPKLSMYSSVTERVTLPQADLFRNDSPCNYCIGDVCCKPPDRLQPGQEIKPIPKKKGSGSSLDQTIDTQKTKPDDCVCVPYYQCYNGIMIEDGFGLIDIF